MSLIGPSSKRLGRHFKRAEWGWSRFESVNASMPVTAELAATDPDYVDSLERGLSVLRALSAREEALSVTDVATLVGITRTAARRFALTLEYLGYASQSAEGYTLAPGVLEIGDAYLRSNPLPDAAHPHLKNSSGRSAKRLR